MKVTVTKSRLEKQDSMDNMVSQLIVVERKMYYFVNSRPYIICNIVSYMYYFMFLLYHFYLHATNTVTEL